MKNKIFFLLFALMLGFATVNAQQSSNEKYEYAIVEFRVKEVYISTTEGTFEERKINGSSRDYNKIDFLNIIKEMNSNGWDVINADFTIPPPGGSPNFFYYLQKKRTN